MMTLFVTIQSFLSSQNNSALWAGIGEHVREMLALNMLQNIRWCFLWLRGIAESTTECPIHIVH